MAITCPNCHEVVKSTDGFCESCGLKIDDLGSSGGNSSQPQKISNEASSARSTTGDIRKICKNQKCTSYNVEYGIDDNYCGVCGLELAVERYHKEQRATTTTRTSASKATFVRGKEKRFSCNAR